MSRLPLARIADLDDPFLTDGQAPISWREFFARAQRLAESLPGDAPLINLCEGRTGFLLGLTAAALAGRVSVLPAARTRAAVEDLAARFPGGRVLADQPDHAGSRLPASDVASLCTGALPQVRDVPSVEAAGEACRVFSSGSTGLPTAHAKSWAQLFGVARRLGERFGFALGAQSVIGSVPPGHMFGLETTVALPLQWGSVLYAGGARLPGDVAQAARALAGERWLMSTPLQLRALGDDARYAPRLEAVVSATMPLAAELAASIEARCGATVHEIYGCTEAGSLATRQTCRSTRWQLLEGITLEERAAAPWVRGATVGEPMALPDIIRFEDAAHFVLLGRAASLVKVAGKRTTLEALNSVLQQLPGVQDATFFIPEETGAGPGRLVAFAVAPERSAEALIAELRERLDPAFLPRPLYLVDQLPRNDLGKLSRSQLAGMAGQLTAARPAVRG